MRNTRSKAREKEKKKREKEPHPPTTQYLGLQYARIYPPANFYSKQLQKYGLYEKYERVAVGSDGNCLWYAFGVCLKHMGQLSNNWRRCGTLINSFKKQILVHMKEKMGMEFFIFDPKKCDEQRKYALNYMQCSDERVVIEKYFQDVINFIPERPELDFDSYDPFDEDNLYEERMGKVSIDHYCYFWAFCNYYKVPLVMYDIVNIVTCVFQESLYDDNVSIEEGVIAKDLDDYPYQIFMDGEHFDVLTKPFSDEYKVAIAEWKDMTTVVRGNSPVWKPETDSGESDSDESDDDSDDSSDEEEEVPVNVTIDLDDANDEVKKLPALGGSDDSNDEEEKVPATITIDLDDSNEEEKKPSAIGKTDKSTIIELDMDASNNEDSIGCASFNNVSEFDNYEYNSQFTDFAKTNKSFTSLPVSKLYVKWLPCMRYYKDVNAKQHDLILHGVKAGQGATYPLFDNVKNLLLQIFNTNTDDKKAIDRNLKEQYWFCITTDSFESSNQEEGACQDMVVAAIVFTLKDNVAFVHWLATDGNMYPEEKITFWRKKHLSLFLLICVFKLTTCNQTNPGMVFLQVSKAERGLSSYYTELGFKSLTNLTDADNGYSKLSEMTNGSLRINKNDYVLTQGDANLYLCYTNSFHYYQTNLDKPTTQKNTTTAICVPTKNQMKKATAC